MKHAFPTRQTAASADVPFLTLCPVTAMAARVPVDSRTFAYPEWSDLLRTICRMPPPAISVVATG